MFLFLVCFCLLTVSVLAESSGASDASASPRPQSAKSSPVPQAEAGAADTAAPGQAEAGGMSHTAAAASSEETARNISHECTFNGRSGASHPLTDGSYTRDFETGLTDGVHSLRILVPAGETAGAVYIQWHMLPVPVSVQTKSESGEWVTRAESDGDFYAQYIPLPGLTDFRIVCRDDPKTQLRICEMKVLTPGAPPEGIQLWEKPGDKVDMMLITGHPDDELLWFGGLLPWYEGEQGKKVLVIVAAMNRSIRRLELLDALWACGVRTHPVHAVLEDFSTSNINEVFHRWGNKERLKQRYTEYYRKYKPDVVVLHDINGEYGHGIHRAVSWLGRECAELAADPSYCPDQVAAWGTWDIPKIYIHLYPENQIRLDWSRPITAKSGKTALEVAQEALQWHKTQIEHGWAVQAGGEMDNELFGLYRTLVGPDVEKNDFFEHIP